MPPFPNSFNKLNKGFQISQSNQAPQQNSSAKSDIQREKLEISENKARKNYLRFLNSTMLLNNPGKLGVIDIAWYVPNIELPRRLGVRVHWGDWSFFCNSKGSLVASGCRSYQRRRRFENGLELGSFQNVNREIWWACEGFSIVIWKKMRWWEERRV